MIDKTAEPREGETMIETPKVIEGSARLAPAPVDAEASADVAAIVEFGNPFGDEFDEPESDPNEIKFDRWKRYANLPAIPGVCGVQPWTRVSTIAKVLDDTYFLDLWKLRQVVIGIKRDPSLLAKITDRMMEQVANHRVEPMPKRTKDMLNQVASKALDVAGSLDGATAGTLFHALMEMIDAGQYPDFDDLTEDDTLMINAYVKTVDRHKIEMVPEWIERVIAIPELNLAGRLDRILLDNGVPRIGDVKSQATMDFGHLSLAAQLACYSRATHMLDQTVKPWVWVPMPEVAQDKGVVIWTPATKPGTAEIYDVNLDLGWEIAKASVQARVWRKTSGLVRRRPS